PEQFGVIAERIYSRSGVVLVTRTDDAAFDEVRARIPEARFNELGRLIHADRRADRTESAELLTGLVLATAGTSDQRVAEEAAVTAELMGCAVERLTDVGVAGLQRLLAARPALEKARVIVVVAGMDGALPSVVAGLVKAPVIAVPTSVGYGAAFEGLSALLSMLNACSPGVVVVNIDNGFGAGYMAATLIRAMSGVQD
ncbi:MAG: nickel pincer cofactor biosynthesis protein LarB, partial [Chloroflexi bacterium]|nr:nickel pincer cofactor biosynthesis protein LarB [Chloroflexota bacterium]